MSVGCLCSHSEGFSNAILEYMAAGLPVVATDAGGSAEAIEDGVTGYVVRTRDPEAFARPILRLLNDETLRGELGRRSLERCRDEFEIGAAVRRLERYYLDLMDLSVPRSREWADAPTNPGDDKSSI
jgi:glycosyltransferase involved in cell wall biosynthesis